MPHHTLFESNTANESTALKINGGRQKKKKKPQGRQTKIGLQLINRWEMFSGSNSNLKHLGYTNDETHNQKSLLPASLLLHATIPVSSIYFNKQAGHI